MRQSPPTGRAPRSRTTPLAKRRLSRPATAGVFYDFGRAVALEGETALVGAPSAASNFRNEGAVYVFGREMGSWQEQQKLVASDGESGDDFGSALALAGDTAMIAADNAQVGEAGQRGAVYVFVREAGEWSERQKLTVNQKAADDFFGSSVVIEGEVAFISALGEDVDGTFNQGAVYVFEREEGEWRQRQKLTASDGGRGDFFGFPLALAGETALIGGVHPATSFKARPTSLCARTGAGASSRSSPPATAGRATILAPPSPWRARRP